MGSVLLRDNKKMRNFNKYIYTYQEYKYSLVSLQPFQVACSNFAV